MMAGIGLGAAFGGLGADPRIALSGTAAENRIPATGDPARKMLPPDRNCLVGFYKPDVPSRSIDHYENSLAAKPALFALWHLISERFPAVEAETVKRKGVVPYIALYPGVSVQKGRREIFDAVDIARGRSDHRLKQLGKGAASFGEKHGGFFLAALMEFNAEWWPWSRKPETVTAARHIWQIFEDQGANRYATWVWEAFCPARYSHRVEDPEPYYPGDKYVDWIGMNVFANLKNPRIAENTRFGELLSPTYEQMTRNHPQKPMMISEFGRTPGEKQPWWLIDAYESIKKEFPRIKAAIYYDNVTDVYGGQDHTLDRKSLDTLKEVFKDPYWAMADRKGMPKGVTAG